jgi:hypothetical protein
MMAELLALTLLRTQAAAAAAVLLVLLLRGPMRAAFGAGLAYRLWALVPVAAIATVFPSLSETLGSGAPPPLMGEERAVLVMAVWLAGGVALATVILLQERAFRARAEAGRAGPAVMGVFWPRVVLPADFAPLRRAGPQDGRPARTRPHQARRPDRQPGHRRHPGPGLVQSADPSRRPVRAAGPGDGLRRLGPEPAPQPAADLRPGPGRGAHPPHRLAPGLLLRGPSAAAAGQAAGPARAQLSPPDRRRGRHRPDGGGHRPGRLDGHPARPPAQPGDLLARSVRRRQPGRRHHPAQAGSH